MTALPNGNEYRASPGLTTTFLGVERFVKSLQEKKNATEHNALAIVSNVFFISFSTLRFLSIKYRKN